MAHIIVQDTVVKRQLSIKKFFKTGMQTASAYLWWNVPIQNGILLLMDLMTWAV